MKSYIRLVFNVSIGLVLFAFSKSFRNQVRAKMRNANDPVNTGEEVIGILRNERSGKTKVIGG